MESAELLDLLGNETRRRILGLLSRKPCYVTEISEVTGVSPKAVIDHLTRLEEAGLIEYRDAQDRRKYFSIVSSQRLEITIAPHEFGTKNGYLPADSLESHRFSKLELAVETNGEVSDPGSLLEELEELRSLSAELSCAQRFVHAEMNRLCEHLVGEVCEDEPGRLSLDVLERLDRRPATADALAEEFAVPPSTVRRYLQGLERSGLVERRVERWHRVR